MTGLIEIGLISEVREDRARVAIGSMVTDFLPVIQLANSFVCAFNPVRVGEQVLILPIKGDLNAGVILRSVYQESSKAPHTIDKEQIFLFEDGVSFSYNTQTSTLSISSPKEINITCQNANINANSTTIKSPSIKLLGNTTIEGAISTSGSGGSGGSFNINGNLNINGSISASGNADFGGSVSDVSGSLTNHTNGGFGRD